MIIAIVNIYVIPESVDQFIASTLENSKSSIKEEGILRFELIEDVEQSNHFLLLEYFKDREAQKVHRETDHYVKWKTAVECMMEIPRTSTKYIDVPIN